MEKEKNRPGEKPEKRKRKGKRTLKKMFSLFLVIVIFGTGCFLLGKFGGGINDRTETDTVVIEHELQEIKELSSLTYHYKDFGKFKDAKMFKDFKIPFTTSEFIVSFEGDIKAGIDLTEVKVRQTADGFTVTLPDAEILSHEIHVDTAEVLDERTSVFNPVKISDYNGFYNSQKGRIEKEALKSGLLETAHKNAITLVSQLLSPFENEETEITVQ